MNPIRVTVPYGYWGKAKHTGYEWHIKRYLYLNIDYQRYCSRFQAKEFYMLRLDKLRKEYDKYD